MLWYYDRQVYILMSVHMSIEVITKAFKELGHPVRLAIYKFVMRAGAQGAPVGKVCDNIKIPNSVSAI